MVQSSRASISRAGPCDARAKLATDCHKRRLGRRPTTPAQRSGALTIVAQLPRPESDLRASLHARQRHAHSSDDGEACAHIARRLRPARASALPRRQRPRAGRAAPSARLKRCRARCLSRLAARRKTLSIGPLRAVDRHAEDREERPWVASCVFRRDRRRTRDTSNRQSKAVPRCGDLSNNILSC